MYILRGACDADKHAVLRWRNAEPVRRTMITQNVIALESHLKWWDKVKADDTKRLLVLEQDAQPLGDVTFFDIAQSSEGRTGWWGFYPADDVAGGPGTLSAWFALERAALAYAFDALGLEALLCETRADNVGVLALHDRVGFETLSRDLYLNAVAHDLIVKRFDRAVYEAARVRGDLLSAQELRLDPDPRDAGEADGVAGTMHFAILGSANWDLGARALINAFKTWTGWSVAAYAPPFGQMAMALLDLGSELRARKRDVWVFAERFEDFGDPFAPPGAIDATAARERFDRYEQLIQHARGEVEGLFLVHDLAPVRPWLRAYDEAAAGTDAASRLCAEFNTRLAALSARTPDCVLVPISALVREVGARQADPGKFWLMGRIAYGAAMTEAWARCVVGAILTRRGLTARALTLDLDNTLWGGAIGDEGVGGISLSSDYPGNEFKVFQRFVASIRARGLPLTISSKNADATAMEAIRSHPEMELREADFVARRINWSPKSKNIREIAAELSLGMGSLMFIDDNPIERAEVRRNCPGVIVPEMPEDVALWPEFLTQHPALAALSLSAEDLDRARSYDIRSQIVAAERDAPTREAFLKDLDMTLEVRDAVDSTMQRVLQLIAKTNQFNTTSRRYGTGDLAGKVAAGGRILTLRLRDKFGSDELIGVLVLDFDAAGGRATIGNFIMSCRVLGRGVEAGALAVAGEAAIAKGCEAIEGEVIVTERNEPCQTVYADNGFTKIGDSRYERLLTDGPPPRPDWLTIVT